MQSLRYTRARDQVAAVAHQVNRVIQPSALVGNWVNTDKASRGIVRLVLSSPDGDFRVQAFGAGSPTPCDWGEVVGEVYADGVNSELAVGFKAFYNFQFMETMLAAYLNKRILVVDSYNTFKDGSGRATYFSRDHFHQ
jgi:hypothetical protein